ncbi:ribonuclease P [Spinellus fusiger]|nr:ribonuclease P [Spinellus fusiger]
MMLWLWTVVTRSDAQRQRYLIQIHLADQALVPGTKRYERMVFCLDKAFGRPMKMVAASVDKVTGSPQEIEWPKGSLWQQHENRGVVEELSDITIPSFDTLQPMMIQAAAWEQSAMSAVEWIGLAHHKAKSTDRPDPFLSVYRPPTPHTTHQKSVIISWKGLILPSLIHSTLLVLRKMMSVKATESWTSLTVWGCQDSPFGWDQQEHHYFLGGENDSTILLLPDSEQGQSSMALYYKMYGSHHVSY